MQSRVSNDERIKKLNKLAREREASRLVDELDGDELEALSMDGVEGLTERVIKTHKGGPLFPLYPDRKVMMRDFQIKSPVNADGKYRVYSNSDLNDLGHEDVRKKIREAIKRGKGKGKGKDKGGNADSTPPLKLIPQ